MADRVRLLLTGANGFLGSHVLRHLLAETDWDITATDRFRGARDRVSEVLGENPGQECRVQVLTWDLTLSAMPPFPEADYVIAMASDVDVAASLTAPQGFIQGNTQIALSTLTYCRTAKPKAVIWVSTGEVYGPVTGPGFAHREWAPVLPPSPYAASKAAQEAVAHAYWRSYGVPVIIVNTMNLFGERQDPAKFLPTVIRKVSAGEEVTIYPGSRNWLHAGDLAGALAHLLRNPRLAMPRGDRPARYNVAGPELSTLLFAAEAAAAAGKPLRTREPDAPPRPGHDPHYALDTDKITAFGWQPSMTIGEGIRQAASWTLKHPEWL